MRFIEVATSSQFWQFVLLELHAIMVKDPALWQGEIGFDPVIGGYEGLH
jgi:hypothetical protein